MTRPAIIIGLGGTGQWVLTYLKKDLLELNNGQLPDNVRLLAFDTVSEAEAEKGVVGSFNSGDEAKYEKTPKRIGSVKLERNVELFHIGGNCKPLAEGIKNGRYPHLEWFDVDYWERARVSWVLDQGAGRFRQFGLLAVYKDLMGGSIRSQILKRLLNALKEVKGTVSGDEKIEIIIVSSVAGGTGSAMLTPFGILARKFGGDRVYTRAIVVLPTAFSPTRTSTDLELRGGAALRELARAMMIPEDYKSRITLVPGERDLDGIEYSRPFDGIYFIDGMREGQPLTNDPKYGVFPAAASWIRQIVDDRSGDWFTRYVSTNRPGAQMNDFKRMAEGVFGVFGVYSLYTPARSLKQTYQLKLAEKVLYELVDPQPEGPGGTLVANRRPPSGAPLPTQRAISILNRPISWGDDQQTLTTIFAQIAEIINQGGAADGKLVDKFASAGIGKSKSEWLALITDIPQGKRFDALRQEVSIELSADFHRAFPASSSYNPPRNPCSKKVDMNFDVKIPAFLNEHYGGQGADGPDDYGKFGEVIYKCIDAHRDIFYDAFRLNVIALLEDNQGKGRLGYTLSVLEALEKHLEVFDDFLKKVENARALDAKLGELNKNVLVARERWQRLKCEKPTLVEKLQRKPSEKALKAEKAYLRAYAELIKYVRENVLHLAVKKLANEIYSLVRNTRQELERWEAMLLEGDTAQNIPGLLRSIEQEKNRVLTTIREDQRSTEIETLVQVTQQESEIDKADVEWALEGVKWHVERADNGLNFELKLEPQGVTSGVLQIIRPEMESFERKQIAAANVNVLGQVLVQRFGQIEKIKPVFQWIQSQYELSDLVEKLDTKTVPLTSLVPDANPVMESFSISVDKEEDPSGYAEQLEQSIRYRITGSKLPDNNHPVAILDAEDPYRLTAVRTQVGLMLDEFNTWTVCVKAYDTEIKKAENASPQVVEEITKTLQSQFTQLAEKEAVAIEVRWRAEGRGPRILHPRVVALLGQRRNLELALQCWALGWVQEVRDENSADRMRWELQIPGMEPFWLTPNRTADKHRGPFEALESFVLVGRNHARDRKGVRLNWYQLSDALRAQSQVGDDGRSPLCKAIERALSDGGLISEWKKRAGETIDPKTDNVNYAEPIYRDLADIAEDYFKKGIQC